MGLKRIQNKKKKKRNGIIKNPISDSLFVGFIMSLICIIPFLLLLLAGFGWFDIFKIWTIDFILWVICVSIMDLDD